MMTNWPRHRVLFIGGHMVNVFRQDWIRSKLLSNTTIPKM